MTKKEYIDLFGENPEDMFGGDWKNIIEEVREGVNNMDCTPDARCINCSDLATCKACENWLLESVSPAVTITVDNQTTKKRFYFSRDDKSLGMIEILTKGGEKND